MTDIPVYKLEAAVLTVTNMRRACYNLPPLTRNVSGSATIEIREEIKAAFIAAETAVDDTSEKFMLKLNAEVGGKRMCVVEVGPFEALIGAVMFSSHHRLLTVKSAIVEATRRNVIWELEDEDAPRTDVIVGATLKVFTDRDGTVASYDLY